MYVYTRRQNTALRHVARVLSIVELLNLIAIYEPSSARVENERRHERGKKEEEKKEKKEDTARGEAGMLLRFANRSNAQPLKVTGLCTCSSS